MMNLAKTRYTAEEYLRLEQTADVRSEFHDGDIIPMPGGSLNHNRIALRLSGILDTFLEDRPFDVFMTDVRLWLPAYRLFTYPDMMVIKEPPKFYETRRDTVTNPVMIAEVLSDSTESYDRGDKFKMYRSIPSLREYLLISQHGMQVEQFVKNDEGQWLLSDFEGEETTLQLRTVALELPLKDLYARVTFENDGEEILSSD